MSNEKQHERVKMFTADFILDHDGSWKFLTLVNMQTTPGYELKRNTASRQETFIPKSAKTSQQLDTISEINIIAPDSPIKTRPIAKSRARTVIMSNKLDVQEFPVQPISWLQ